MEERKEQGLLGNIHDLLLESTFYNYSYIDLGRLAESSHGVDVVVEDDDPHHHPHAEHQRFFARKPTPVLPEREEKAVALLPGQGCSFLAPHWLRWTLPTLSGEQSQTCTNQVNTLF